MGNELITGLEIDSSGISWNSARRRKKRLEVSELRRKDVALTGTAEGVDFEAEENLHALKKALSGVEGLCCYALPASSMLLRVTELPSTDAKELESMVELQVDKFCPFAIEQMQYSFEVLVRREEGARVLIAAVKKDVVTALGSALRHGGIILHRLDCRAVVWWSCMKERGLLATHGRQTILLLEANDISMIVLHHGEPVIFRALGMCNLYELREDFEDLLNEVRFTLTTLEAEWGSAEEVCLDVWSAGDVPEPFRIVLEEAYAGLLHFHRLNELPPLTEAIARRSAEPGATLLNLSPSTWLADERYRAALRRLGLLSALFLGLWLTVMVVLMVYMHIRMQSFDALQSGHAALQEQANTARKLRAKVKSLQQYSDRSRSALEVLREVSIRLPAGVDLTSMSYKKGEAANVKGTAGEAEPIHDFIAAVEQSGLFTNVVADNIVSKRDHDKVRTDFSIELKLPGGE